MSDEEDEEYDSYDSLPVRDFFADDDPAEERRRRRDRKEDSIWKKYEHLPRDKAKRLVKMERELDTGMAEVEMEEKVPRFVDTRGETTPDEIMELLPPQPVTQVLTDPKDPEYGTEGPTRDDMIESLRDAPNRTFATFLKEGGLEIDDEVTRPRGFSERKYKADQWLDRFHSAYLDPKNPRYDRWRTKAEQIAADLPVWANKHPTVQRAYRIAKGFAAHWIQDFHFSGEISTPHGIWTKPRSMNIYKERMEMSFSRIGAWDMRFTAKLGDHKSTLLQWPKINRLKVGVQSRIRGWDVGYDFNEMMPYAHFEHIQYLGRSRLGGGMEQRLSRNEGGMSNELLKRTRILRHMWVIGDFKGKKNKMPDAKVDFHIPFGSEDTMQITYNLGMFVEHESERLRLRVCKAIKDRYWAMAGYDWGTKRGHIDIQREWGNNDGYVRLGYTWRTRELLCTLHSNKEGVSYKFGLIMTDDGVRKVPFVGIAKEISLNLRGKPATMY